MDRIQINCQRGAPRIGPGDRLWIDLVVRLAQVLGRCAPQIMISSASTRVRTTIRAVRLGCCGAADGSENL